MKKYNSPEIELLKAQTLESIAAGADVSESTWGDMEDDGMPDEI